MEQTLEKKLTDLKVGDKVFVGRSNNWATYSVKRLTNTQIIIDVLNYAGQPFERRFYKKNGVEVGSGDTFYNIYLKVWTEEFEKKIAQEGRYKEVLQIIPSLQNKDAEKTDRIYNFLKQEGILKTN